MRIELENEGAADARSRLEVAVAAVTERARAALSTGLIAALLAGCGTAPARVAPPAEVYEAATPVAAPRSRSWGDGLDVTRREEVAAAIRAGMIAEWERRGQPVGGLDLDLLALSGGGPDGAYAAGLLSGWTERGDRPDFGVVTGISVGALIAPLAFLGPEWDDVLRRAATETAQGDVAEVNLLAPLFGALGLADSTPLRATIAAIVDEAFLARVAAEHRKGRQLLIGTTNLDAQRPVVWNMGEIAEAGALKLFRDVMLASASIPGAFPPVPIAVEAGGGRFTELHVDGGVTHSVLIGPNQAETAVPRDLPFPVRWTFHIVQNNGLLPAYAPVEDRLLPIARRSVSTLIRGQTNGDLDAIYRAAQALDATYRLTFVPPDFSRPAQSAFDPDYMAALFETGRRRALDGAPWLAAPPDRLERREIERRLLRGGATPGQAAGPP